TPSSARESQYLFMPASLSQLRSRQLLARPGISSVTTGAFFRCVIKKILERLGDFALGAVRGLERALVFEVCGGAVAPEDVFADAGVDAGHPRNRAASSARCLLLDRVAGQLASVGGRRAEQTPIL